MPGAAGFEPQIWDQLSLALPAALMALANFKQTLQQLINLDLGPVFQLSKWLYGYDAVSVQRPYF